LLCAGITMLNFKYSYHQFNKIIKVIVTNLKQWSQPAGNFIYSLHFNLYTFLSSAVASQPQPLPLFFKKGTCLPILASQRVGEEGQDARGWLKDSEKTDESTSETLRESYECIATQVKNISIHVPTYLKPESDTAFGHYLAGLIEGDGHFSNTPQLVLVFNELDASLAYYIKGKIGFGNVYKVKSKKAVILVIANRQGLIKVLSLINGKIRSEKRLDQIKNNILSNPYFNMFSNFSINTNADLNNHWLTGFSDATASFQIQLRTSQNQPVLTEGGAGNKTPYTKALPETRIVVWGQNLSSSVGLGRFTKQVSNMIQIPAYQQSVITGLMLSDGWLIFGSKTSKSARLGFKQSLSHLDYFWFVFRFLSPYCNSIPNLRSSYRKETKTYALEIFTRSLPCFTELHDIYYDNGIKLIPADIFNLLTPIAMAHWISGDGAKNRHGLTISTESFSVKDTIRLLNVLMIRYRLNCSLRKHSVGYVIKENSMPLLRTIVRPYMHSSMLYKLRIDPDVKDTTQVNNDSKGYLEEKEDKLNSFILQGEETKICRNTCNKNNILKTKSDASFQIKILTRKHRKPEVRLNFQIDQKNNDLLILIKNFLGGNIGHRKSKNTYYFGSTSFTSARNVIKYFDQFPLLSSKHVNYLKWRKAYILIQNKDHLTEAGLNKITKLKKTMNRNNEDHAAASNLS